MSPSPSPTPVGHVHFDARARLQTSSRRHKSECSLRLRSKRAFTGTYSHLVKEVCRSARVCVCPCVWHSQDSRRSLCAVCDFMAQEALSCTTRTRRGSEWSGGSEPAFAHRCPLSWAPGSQSTPRGGRPFGPCSWDMFLGLWGWQLEVSRFLPAAATMPRRWARRR